MRTTRKPKNPVEYSDILVRNLAGLIRHTFKQERDYLEHLSVTERHSEGTFEKWAPKDIIAHNMYWRRRCNETLAYTLRGIPAPEYADYNQMNAENYVQYQNTPLLTIVKEAEQTVIALSDNLARFTAEDLLTSDKYPWQKGHPLIGYVLSNGAIHPITHIAASYIAYGMGQYAVDIQERLLDDVLRLTDVPDVIALCQYDLACMYANSNMPAKVFPLLEAAFVARPELVAWSQEDADLDPIRADERYLTLIQKPQA
jgi:hypothetical protein